MKFLKHAGIFLKIAVVAATFIFIYRQVFVKHDIGQIRTAYAAVLDKPLFWPMALAVFSLMAANWWLEVGKWQLMIRKIENVSFARAMRAVFAGVTVSLFTPNRVGEFAGRVAFLEKGDKIQGALISVLSGMSQLLITIAAGGISLVVFLFTETAMEYYILMPTAFSIIALVALLTLCYFNSYLLSTLAGRVAFLKKRFSKYTEVFSWFSASDLSRALLYSAGRYMVFTVQYLLLLFLMDVKVPLPEGVMMISLIFLVMALPNLGITEFGMRGATACYFLGMLTDNTPGIIAASFSLWLVNLTIPALAGTLFIMKIRFKK